MVINDFVFIRGLVFIRAIRGHKKSIPTHPGLEIFPSLEGFYKKHRLTFAPLFTTMLKQFTAAMLFLAFFAGSFSKSLIVADYFVNTSSYAKDCINKARPKMHCNGKCQMMMKIKAEEKKESDNNEKKSNIQNEVISSKSFFTASVNFTEQVQYAETVPVFNDNSTSSMPRACFHPPSC